MDTERHTRWLAMLAASDKTLVQLALIAVAAVVVWEAVRGVGEPWRGRLRLAYVALALAYLLMQLVTPASSVALALVCAVVILTRRVWLSRSRRPAGAAVKG